MTTSQPIVTAKRSMLVEEYYGVPEGQGSVGMAST